MKKFCKLVCMMIAVSICFIGCRENRQASAPLSDIPQAGERKEVTALSEQFKTGINNFSYQIFEQLENGENIFISPYSMAVDLSMLDNGAEGKSKEEIEQMLGIKDLEDWNACVKYYMSFNKDEKSKLLTANSLWLSEDIVLSDNAESEFFNPVQWYYDAEKKQMNLASTDAMKQINQWVSDHTNGMIDSILNEPLEKSIKMALLNAVYFKGEWKEQFEKENTQKAEFYGKDKTLETDMMHQANKKYKYIEKDGIKAIELPYANGQTAMDIFIPMSDVKKNEPLKNISELFSNLSIEEKAELFTTLSGADEQTICVVELPKFELEYGMIDISASLQKLGMKEPFCNASEFSKISPNLQVGQVFHKAKVEVDEKGTKASAVTMITKENGVEAFVDEEIKEFIVDKPFIFAIRDVENDVILFMGSMQNLE